MFRNGGLTAVPEPETVRQIALWSIPAAPLAACVLIALTGVRWLRERSHYPCILALVVSLGSSLGVLAFAIPQTPYDVDRPYYPAVVSAGYEWIRVGGLNVSITLTADAMGAVMLTMVTLVSLLVAIYSAGYMRGDPGYARFFAEVSLFVFSMCMLVLADNFLVLYVFWEAVGLCSYLLIGFWFRRPSAAAAARKAFLVNRIGDFGFLLGVFLIWVTFGTLDYQGVLGREGYLQQIAQQYPGRLELICLLLFLGAVGKSAQFPLHVWLPDAMEGPSPVSALIHAATMVTAGVYMVARCTPLFVACACGPIGCGRDRRVYGVAGGADRADAVRSEACLGLLDSQPIGLHVPGLGMCRGRRASGDAGRDGGDVPPVHARLFQSLAVPQCRQRHALDGRRDRHAAVRRLAACPARHASRRFCAARQPWRACRCCPDSGARTRSWPPSRRRRTARRRMPSAFWSCRSQPS